MAYVFGMLPCEGMVGMENVKRGAAYYRARAEEMRALIDSAQTEALKISFLRLEASWLKLAEAAEKTEAAESEDDEPSRDTR